MKILFFIESLRSGGRERRLLELINYLKFKANYEVVLVLTEKTIHYDYVYKWDIPIIIIERKGLKRDPRLFYNYFRICQQIKPDIIHTWGIMNTFYAIPTKLILRIPLVSSLISNAKSNLKRWSWGMFLFKTSCIFSNSIFSNSQAGVEAYKLKGRKIKVIYNGVDIERFEYKFDKDQIKNKLNIKTKYIIVMVASVNTNKNYDLFIDVAKEISLKNKDITFVGVGGGTDFKRISERVYKEHIENVLFIGASKEVESIVYSSDIGVLFTFSEGFPNSVMEYMALKKPVIVTNAGGSKELIKENETGYLISNGDINDICNKIVFLIENPKIRESLGQKGYETIKNEYSIENMAKKFILIYSDHIPS